MIFNWADWVIVAIVIVSCLFGLKRGLIKEALSVGNWVVALVVAQTFRAELAELLSKKIETPSVRELVSFGVLFFVTLMVGAAVTYLISEVVKATGLSSTDRTLGMVFGLLRGFIVVMALLILVPTVISIDQDVWWAHSILIPHFLAFEDWARAGAGQISQWVMELFNQT